MAASAAICRCPLCAAEIPPEDVQLRFDCPHCHKPLRTIRSRSYVWIRFLVCLALGEFVAWRMVHDLSFTVFVVAVPTLMFLLLWIRLIEPLLPPATLQPEPSLHIVEPGG
jgi:predicted RNA-binding Zn-ribbon protein involved in translation (DUF1610 family)